MTSQGVHTYLVDTDITRITEDHFIAVLSFWLKSNKNKQIS